MDSFKIRDKRNKNYFTADNEVVDMIPLIGTAAFTIYMIFCKYVDKNEECYPPQEQLAKLTGLYRETVIDKIKILKDYNMISIEHSKDKDTGKWLHNTYTLLDKTVWVKTLHGDRMGKNTTRTEADTVSVNSDTNNTHVLNNTQLENFEKELPPTNKQLKTMRSKSKFGVKSTFTNPTYKKMEFTKTVKSAAYGEDIV